VALEGEAPRREDPVGDEARDEREHADGGLAGVEARGKLARGDARAESRLDGPGAFLLARDVALAHRRRIADLALQKRTAQEIEEFVIESVATKFPEGLISTSA